MKRMVSSSVQQNLLKMSTDLQLPKGNENIHWTLPHLPLILYLHCLRSEFSGKNKPHCLGQYVVLSYFTQYPEKKVEKNFNYIYSVPLHLFFPVAQNRQGQRIRNGPSSFNLPAK